MDRCDVLKCACNVGADANEFRKTEGNIYLDLFAGGELLALDTRRCGSGSGRCRNSRNTFRKNVDRAIKRCGKKRTVAGNLLCFDGWVYGKGRVEYLVRRDILLRL